MVWNEINKMTMNCNNNKYVQAIYLVGIKCMIDLLVTKVTKSIRLFNSKLMIISITHRIMDAKLYDYCFMGTLKFIVIRHLWIAQRLISCYYN